MIRLAASIAWLVFIVLLAIVVYREALRRVTSRSDGVEMLDKVYAIFISTLVVGLANVLLIYTIKLLNTLGVLG